MSKKLENQEQPKKSLRSRSKSINLSIKRRWQDIVKGVEKKEVPIGMLQEIVVKLVDGTTLTIAIKQMLDEGHNPIEIEDLLNDRFQELDSYIENVDFFINIDKVVDTIQPETDRVLKNL